MNKIYRIIWNNILSRWVVTSELGRAKIKGAANTTLAAPAMLAGSSATSLKEKLKLRCPMIVAGIKAAIMSSPLFFGVTAIDAEADTNLGNSSSTVNLATYSPESNFNITAPSTLTSSYGNVITGNNSANWLLTNYGSLLNNASGGTGASAVVSLDASNVGGASLINYGIISASVPNVGISGVVLKNGGTVFNHQGASITSAGFYGVLGSNSSAPVNIYNEGNITGNSSGVRLSGGGTFTQSASGITTGTAGLGLLNDGGALTVQNAGTILGGDTAGVFTRGGTTTGSINNSGSISGPNALLIQSNGMTVTNSGTLTGSNGTAMNITGSNNQVILQTGSTINGSVTSTGSSNTVALQGNGTANNTFSGISTLSALDIGTWTLGGNVTTTAASSSATDVENGTLTVSGQLNNSGSGAGTSILNGGTMLVSGQVTNNAGTSISKGSTLTVSGQVTNNGTGTVISDGSTLQIGTGGTSGSVTGNVSVGDNSQLIFNHSDSVMYNSVISGTGTLVQNGNNMLVLGGNNSYSGGTIINNGAVRVINGGNLGSGNIIDNATLQFSTSSPSTVDGVISGTGALTQMAASTLILTGNNTFTGNTTISNSSGVLQLGAGGTTGNLTGNVINNGTLSFNRSDDLAYNGKISGSGAVTQNGSGTVTLGGANTYNGATRINTGTLAITADNNLGSGSASNSLILNGGNLEIANSLTSARTAQLAQSGSIIADSGVTASLNGWNGNGSSDLTKAGDGALIFTGDNSANTSAVNINGGVLQVATLDQLASAEGVLNLGNQGTLSVQKDSSSAADLNVGRQLNGSGQLLVNLGDSAQELIFADSAAGGNFTGLVTLDTGHLALNSNTGAVMNNATLQLNQQGSTTLTGQQTMQGLTLNGGKLEVGYSADTDRPLGELTVNTLDASNGGALVVNTPLNLTNPQSVGGTSLFDQQEQVIDQIVSAQNVVGAGSQIAFTYADGSALGDDLIQGLEQNGVVAGNAHYNYAGMVKEDGLYVGYGLTQIDALEGQSVILDNSQALSNTLGAKLSGSGGFDINATDDVRIGNAASDYTGATRLNSGSVTLTTDNALGQTSALNMASGTSLDVNGNSQTVGALNTAQGSVLALSGGNVTVSNGGTAAGEISGEGVLTLSGNALTLSNNNSNFSGTTAIQSGATAILTQLQGLGTGNITDEGTLELQNVQGAFLNTLAGQQGEVSLTQAADLTLGNNNQDFAGRFAIDANSTLTASNVQQLGTASVNNDGKLVVDNADDMALTNTVTGSGSLIKQGSGTLTIDGDNVSQGQTAVENGTLLVGSTLAQQAATLVSDVNVATGATLGGYGSVNGNVTNAGALAVGQALTGNGHGDFTINGNYEGQNGAVRLDTDMGGDNASTDKLVINGASTGHSTLSVQSARGEGADTVDGIKIIDVTGASSGKFTLAGRAVAGPYEYFLRQGTASKPGDGSWYLTSSQSGTDSGDGGNTDTGGDGKSGGGNSSKTLRPEAGGYMANMAAAQTMFNQSLSDREGRAEDSSLWLRQSGSHTGFSDGSGQLNTSANGYVVQGGGEVWNGALGQDDRLGLGLMAGYGYNNSNTTSSRTGYKSHGTVDGYSAGAYATWYQDTKNQNGAYVDTWMQYSWLKASQEADQTQAQHYNINGLSASLESGYRMPVYQTRAGQVFITPQAQVIWDGQKADDLHDESGTNIQSAGNNAVHSRVGVRVSHEGVSTQDKGKDKLFTVYSEVNWLYSTKEAGSSMDDVTVSQAGSRNVGEVKLGVEGKLNKNLNLWSHVGQQMGGAGYNDSQLTIGIKYGF